MNLEIKHPKILIISNNSLSETSNNGKTLASFFDDYPPEKIGQLYFSSEVPNSKNCDNYFRITDSEIIKHVLHKSEKVGKKIKVNEYIDKNRKNNKIINIAQSSNFSRIIREFFWKSRKWESINLIKWLDELSPEIIFFCAGDSGFAYDITNSIKKKYNSKLAIYLTDDYILPRKSMNLFWWLRRNYILKKMKFTISRSDLFFTISDKMKKNYKKIFKKDSIVVINMVESLKENNQDNNNDIIKLVYAGGLHYKRYKTLYLLAKAIKKYNEDEDNKKKALLKIYSMQYVDKNKKKYLNIQGSSEFCGGVNSNELKEILNQCDIPVHVESFDEKSIESTKLSISTKIPEYLSLNKPILAIGPKEIASMEYIKNSAYCITNPDDFYMKLKKFLNDINLQNELSEKALEKYNSNHNKKNVSTTFLFELLKLTNKI